MSRQVWLLLLSQHRISWHARSDALLVDLQAAFSKRMLAGVMSAGDTGLAMGLLCLLQRMFRCRQASYEGALLFWTMFICCCALF